jgi:hypothetical protein
MDVQGAVDFAEHVLINAARLWAEFSLEQNQRLQQVLFSKGVQFSNGAYRTEETSPVFFELQTNLLTRESLVALPGIEPGFSD